MAKKKVNKKNKKWKITNLVFAFFLLIIIGLYIQYCYLSLSKKIYGRDMEKFAANRNTVSTELIAERGKIYDINGEELALNVKSYTLIAYLDKSRDIDKNHPKHVVDKEETAKKLSEVLDADYNYIYERLNAELYKVQFGHYGRNITELKKIEIEKLKLPGISFEESFTRYYPNGNFASQVIGYAKADDDGIISGKLGIESKYNKKLKGTNGYYSYQKDSNGYKIPDTPEERQEALNGDDIYLTIDSNIQRFVEKAITSLKEEYTPDWALIEVMNAKTGAILGSGDTTGFDPNDIPEEMSYENPLVSYVYEPGSTMKIYTYMCAMEKGVYNGSEIYKSGSFKIGDDTINDWIKAGWGDISYDAGFEYSSNVAIANLITNHLSLKELKSCQEKFGFGSTTGIELSHEARGSLSYKYPIEVVAAGYGQGILTTPVQHLQALSVIANDGYIVKPHIISKTVNSQTGKETVTKTSKSKTRIVSKSTINQIKNLMEKVVSDDWATGHKYYIENYDIIGKTGTAQIYENGHYLTGDTDYVTSIALMYPKDDPQIIIYAAIKKPSKNHNSALTDNIKELIRNIAKYQGTFSDYEAEVASKTMTLQNYQGKNPNDVINKLTNYNINIVVIGNGDKVIKQSPNKNNKVTYGDRLFLLTNGDKISMLDMTGWTRADVVSFCKLVGIECSFEGNGYVISQSIAASSDATGKLNIVLEEKH